MEIIASGSALSPRLEAELCLGSAFLAWILIVWWIWASGWRIQRRYFIEARFTPMRRARLTWGAGLIGFVAVVASHAAPSTAGFVTVAMVGTLSAITDARTHKLPNMYTLAMAIGVAVGATSALLLSDDPLAAAMDIAWGIVIWLVPMWILSRMPGGLGFGDVKLAPILGAMLGTEGVDAAIFGLLFSVCAAGAAAVWRLVVGSAGTSSRMPLGPWLIGGSLAAFILQGIIPQWL